MKEQLVLFKSFWDLKTITLGAFVATIPFSRSASLIIFSIFVLFWLAESPIKEKYLLILRRWAVLLPSLLFLIYALSLLYSDNKSFFLIEKRLLLFFLPFMIGSTKFNKEQIIVILNIFIAGCLLFTIWSIILAFQFYNLPTEHFSLQHLPHQLSRGFHAPYLSLFLVLSNFFVLFQSLNGEKLAGWKIFILLYFGLFIVILSSRTALICNTALLLFYFYLHFSIKKKKKYFWLLILALCMAFAATYQFYPHFQERFSAVSNVGNGIIDRFITFNASIEIILENPIFGVGIGDLQKEMSFLYDKMGLSSYFYGLNAHNEYLFTTASTGFVGLTVLLTMMFYPVYISFKSKNYFIIAFYFIFSLAFMTEVVLGRYWGVAAFSFLYPVFTSYLLDLANNKEGFSFLKRKTII